MSRERAKYIRGTLAERFWAKVDVRGPDECSAIRASTAYGREIAAQFGISVTHINRIRRGKAWLEVGI